MVDITTGPFATSLVSLARRFACTMCACTTSGLHDRMKALSLTTARGSGVPRRMPSEVVMMPSDARSATGDSSGSIEMTATSQPRRWKAWARWQT
jgi:hypothetical protein